MPTLRILVGKFNDFDVNIGIKFLLRIKFSWSNKIFTKAAGSSTIVKLGDKMITSERQGTLFWYVLGM